MKRWSLNMAACLLLGAATTIAVAWACAWSIRIEHVQRIVGFSDAERPY